MHRELPQPPTKLQPQLKLAQKLLQNNLKDIYMCGKNATYMDDNQQINTYENNNNNVKITKKKREKWGKKINMVQNVVEG